MYLRGFLADGFFWGWTTVATMARTTTTAIITTREEFTIAAL